MAGHNFPRHSGSTRTGGRYDWAHQQARTRAAQRHDPSHPCTRCGKPLGPMSRNLHYDHTDDGQSYLGFAHAECNRKAGARRGNALQRATTRRWTSRNW